MLSHYRSKTMPPLLAVTC